MKAEAVSVTKFCGENRTRAIDKVSLSLESGRLHAVCGENGAGKTTILRVLAGLLSPDEGSVTYDGKTVRPHTTIRVRESGLAMVEQHFALVSSLTAVENTALALGGPLVLDLAAVRSKLAQRLEQLGMDVPLDVPCADLSIGQQQRLELARALLFDAKILVLDEPTAVLSPVEADQLYVRLVALVEQGLGVVVVTHKLSEVERFADFITVLRKGKLVFERSHTRGGSVDDVLRSMMGDAAVVATKPSSAFDDHVVLRATGVCVDRSLTDFNLELKSGELVGIAGVDGNGQMELIHALSGLVPPTKGTIWTEGGSPVTVFGDRHREEILLGATILDNAVLGEHARFARAGILDETALRAEATKRMTPAGLETRVSENAGALSGGNQQKLVMARGFARLKDGAKKVLVIAHPTRGVDVGAAAHIRSEIAAAKAEGAGVLVVSADLDELRQLSTRILVLREGRVVGTFSSNTSDEVLGRAMVLAEDHDAGVAAQTEAPE